MHLSVCIYRHKKRRKSKSKVDLGDICKYLQGNRTNKEKAMKKPEKIEIGNDRTSQKVNETV